MDSNIQSQVAARKKTITSINSYSKRRKRKDQKQVYEWNNSLKMTTSRQKKTTNHGFKWLKTTLDRIFDFFYSRLNLHKPHSHLQMDRTIESRVYILMFVLNTMNGAVDWV